MNFVETILSYKPILTEGSVVERLRRDSSIPLDPHIAHAGFVYDENGRAELSTLYRQYFDIGMKYNLPMIGFTPTWRSSQLRLRQAGFDDSKDVNGDCVRFVRGIRQQYAEYGTRIFIGGLVGCKGDAYDPKGALPSNEALAFHRFQLRALATAGVDFLFGATLPAFSEALGLAAAMAGCDVPYALSFVLRADGSLLDGTALHEAIGKIDSTVQPPPLFYMSNCVHPSALEGALEIATRNRRGLNESLIGLQANGSRKNPAELNNRASLDSGDPESIADSMLHLRHRFGLRVLGGCCGTDHRHIECIAKRLVAGR